MVSLFLFQSSLQKNAPDFASKFSEFSADRKAEIHGMYSKGMTAEKWENSAKMVYGFYSAVKENKALPPADRKAALDFIATWCGWAGGAAKDGFPAGAKAALQEMQDDAEVKGHSSPEFSSYLSVLGMASGYSSEGKFISRGQADMMAGFLVKMADISVMNYYQRRLLVSAMVEVAAGGSAPDNWIFKFSTPGDALDFVKILGALPGFSARNVQQAGTAVSFSLRQSQAAEGAVFNVPQELQGRKGAPIIKTDGAVHMAASSSITLGDAVTPVPYLTSKEEVLASEASDNPTSYMKRPIDLAASTALLYGEGYETDERDSYFFASLRAKAMISDLARSFGFTISEPLEDWIASKQEGGGQAFLAKLNEAGITLDVIGSADMAVFYDGKNKAEWAAAADKNLSLAQKRSGLVIKYLTSLNSTVLADSENKLQFANTPNGHLHFFQDFTAEEAKEIGIPKYGYADGDGAKNMAALMAYLKAAYTIDEKTGKPPEFIRIGQNQFSFTDDERADAGKFYGKLAEIINENGTLKAGAIPLLNTYFRRMSGDPSLKGPGVKGGMIYEGKTAPKGKEQFIAPNVFARAIMQSTEVSSRSVKLSARVEAELAISVKAEDGKAAASVSYRINGVDVPFNAQNGAVETYFEKTASGADRAMGAATTLDGSLNSGYAWQTIEVKKPVFQIERYTLGGEVRSQYVGTYLPLPFSAYSLTRQGPDEENTTTVRKPINSMLCFGVRTTDKALNHAPKYLLYPGEVEVKKDAPVYKLGNDYVVVDRDLYYRGEKFATTKKYELYKKQADLEALARKGVVALFVQPATGKGAWVKLDGSLVDEKTMTILRGLGANEDAADVLYGPKTFAQKTVVSFLNNPNYTIRADAPETGEVPNIVANEGDKYQSSHLPNAMVVESKKDAWLARQHIIAKVEVDPADPNKANVMRLDGKSIGALDISLAEKPDLAGKTRFEKKNINFGWERTNELKMASQMGLLSECGLFLFKPREESEGFTYLTYIPRTKNTDKIMGYIYSMSDFFKSRRVDVAEE